jgi:hypothetical protein
MAIENRFCANHPQRLAIGVCVMTAKPICGECSTRYEGVNYSREGLALLQKQRAAAEKNAHSRKRVLANVLLWMLSPVMVYLMYYCFVETGNFLATLLHEGF